MPPAIDPYPTRHDQPCDCSCHEPAPDFPDCSLPGCTPLDELFVYEGLYGARAHFCVLESGCFVYDEQAVPELEALCGIGNCTCSSNAFFHAPSCYERGCYSFATSDEPGVPDFLGECCAEPELLPVQARMFHGAVLSMMMLIFMFLGFRTFDSPLRRSLVDAAED